MLYQRRAMLKIRSRILIHFRRRINIPSLYNKAFQFLWKSIIGTLFLMLLFMSQWSEVVMAVSNDGFISIKFLMGLIP